MVIPLAVVWDIDSIDIVKRGVLAIRQILIVYQGLYRGFPPDHGRQLRFSCLFRLAIPATVYDSKQYCYKHSCAICYEYGDLGTDITRCFVALERL